MSVLSPEKIQQITSQQQQNQIRKILEHIIPDGHTEDNQWAIYREFDSNHEIHQNYDSDEFRIKSLASGQFLNHIELETWIRNNQQPIQTIHAQKTSGYKPLSFVQHTLDVSKLKDIQSCVLLPTSKKVEIDNLVMQKRQPEISKLNDEQLQEHMYALEREMNLCKELAIQKKIKLIQRQKEELSQVISEKKLSKRMKEVKKQAKAEVVNLTGNEKKLYDFMKKANRDYFNAAEREETIAMVGDLLFKSK